MVKKRSLIELTNAFNEILNVSKKYSYLWDKGFIDGGIDISGGFIAQDESFSINVTKYDNKFLIGGRNFGEGKGLSARNAALKIRDHFSTFVGLEADDLKEGFYSSFKRPLGNYLAEKELKVLTNFRA